MPLACDADRLATAVTFIEEIRDLGRRVGQGPIGRCASIIKCQRPQIGALPIGGQRVGASKSLSRGSGHNNRGEEIASNVLR
jgi:hypothetical protein